MLDFLRDEGVSPQIIAEVEAFRAKYPVGERLAARVPVSRYLYYGKDVWEEALTALLCGENLLLAVKILWDAQTALRSSEDPRGALELSLVLISGALSRGRSQNVRTGAEVTPTPVGAARDAAPSAPPRKLSLAEMQQARKETA